MNIQIDIKNSTIYNNLVNADCRYWCVEWDIDQATLKGYVIEWIDDETTIRHELDVAEGIQRLAGYSGRLFGRLIDERDGLDAGMANDFLQLCAGVMYKDEPKYG